MRECTMKKVALSFIGALLTLVSPYAFSQSISGDPSQLPMYGGMDRQADPILKGADEALIEGTTKEFV
jgi:hypothetical protein